MKVVKIQGGLGNQLFCLAFARSVAVLTGERVGVDVSAFRFGRYGHRFVLDDLAERLSLEVVRRPLLSPRPVGMVLGRLPGGYVAQGAPPANRAAFARLAAGGGYFDGYWQDEAWVAADAGLRATIRDWLLEKGGRSTARDVVVHYRTYKEEVRPARRATPDAAWFAAAIARAEAIPGAGGEIVLISDDPDLALDRLGDIGRRLVVPRASSPWADMALMLRARALVLSNSSFSWWGGWCGEAATIVYPAPGHLHHYPAPAQGFTVL
ncbi:MAG: hypothetical protein ABI376_00270 [Caulobacteraceae bacterium]